MGRGLPNSAAAGHHLVMPDAPTTTWIDQDWLASAQAWIDDQLGSVGLVRAGDIEQPHVYPWSTVLRIPTDQGVVWFKANSAELRHEPKLVNLLASRRPDLVPPLLAFDGEHGWMLMADAGVQLRSVVAAERSLHRWLDVCRLTAELQLDVADAVLDMVALGVPDLRLAALPHQYDRLVHALDTHPRYRRAVSHVAALCEQLDGFGIPASIQHDDLHDGQVYLRDGRYRLLDWGDACVSHPFFTLSVALEGVVAWGLDDVEKSVEIAPFRDAYLGPYTQRYDGDLVAACDIALRLGWVCRAVNGHMPGDEQQTHRRLSMFLDGHA